MNPTGEGSARSSALNLVSEALLNARGAECVAVLGGPLTGKTRLVQHLSGSLQLPSPPLLLDGQRLASSPASELPHKLVASIDAHIEASRKAGSLSVVLIDDFDLVMPAVPVATLQILRERFSQVDCGLVITTREPLAAIARTAGLVSRFEELFGASIACGLLSEEEALALVTCVLPKRLPPDSLSERALTSWILREAGLHPVFLDDLSRRIRDRAQKGAPVDGAFLQGILDNVPLRWERYFTAIWRGLSRPEADVVSRA